MLFRNAFLLLFCAFALPAAAMDAVRPETIRIGVLTDMSGSMAGSSGLGSVEAAQMAVEDMSAEMHQRPVVVINADFQNRCDLAEHISESWVNKQGVDVVVDVPSGPIAAKLQDFFHEHKKLLLTSSPSSLRFRDKACHGHSMSWLYDRDTLTLNLIKALMDENKKRWFIIKSDDGYSSDLTKVAKKRLKELGGELVGEAQFGKRMSGLQIILEQAETVKPDIIFLAFDRPDLLHILSHWPHNKNEGNAPLAFTSLHVNDVHELENKPVPVFFTMSPFYWNQDDATRQWSNKFAARNRGAMPTDIQAGVYSSVRHYLRNLKISNTDGANNVLTRMKAGALDDPLFGASKIREDGLVMHRLLLLSSMKDLERNKPWDMYRIVRTIHPADVMLPAQVSCKDE